MERDRYLTEAMGECWHEINNQQLLFSQRFCTKCGENRPAKNIDFSTWQGLGKLLPFADEKIGFEHIMIIFNNCWPFDDGFCDRFANALYEFLKSREG